jgi:23S rRNA pseudouridine1911/1915/1917 synthase
MGLFPKDRNLAQPPDRVELAVRASDFQLPADELALRLDAFLHHHLHWRSRSSVQRLVREGRVEVAERDGARGEPAGAAQVETRCARQVRHGMRVVVHIPPAERLPVPTSDPSDLAVLYEDEDVVAIDKPPFLPVHPSGRHVADTLIQRVHARYFGESPRNGFALRLCHRLDRETSGVVLCGKGEDAHRALMRQFERRTVDKEYLAIVRGSVGDDEGVVDLPLGPSRASRVHLKIAVAVDGQPSRTTWRVLERRPGCTLVSCRPHTGRQHQIRVHMEALGHPLVGDKLYGGDESFFLRAAAGELTPSEVTALGMARHALHGHRLAFTSPSSGARVEVVSPLATDMRAFLDAE